MTNPLPTREEMKALAERAKDAREQIAALPEGIYRALPPDLLVLLGEIRSADLLERLSGVAWQPIETAPKDYSVVLW